MKFCGLFVFWFVLLFCFFAVLPLKIHQSCSNNVTFWGLRGGGRGGNMVVSGACAHIHETEGKEKQRNTN